LEKTFLASIKRPGIAGGVDAAGHLIGEKLTQRLAKAAAGRR
jgi:hypothetical protein